jgi:prolyl oligopeptidase PreP (S9A serine peptidase family)
MLYSVRRAKPESGMGRHRGLRRICLAVGVAGLLAGCAGIIIGHPTPVPGKGPMGEPRPTATQIAVGANPSPSAPRMNPFVAELQPRGSPGGGNPYGWLHAVRSNRTRHWILVENRASRKALAAIPRRAWIADRLERLQGPDGREAATGIVIEHASYLGPDGVRLPLEIAHRRDVARDGNQPTLLTVYRTTGKPREPLLRPFVLAWLELGGVYARAEVRNGLARIPAPRGAAQVPDRSIALSDLFAAAQSLIDAGYTRRQRLGVYGRGFGGLLAGAAITRRPGFFGAALPTGTWPEYRQISSGNCFPATFIVTAEHDGVLRPWRGYELAAALQAEQLCGRPILIRIDTGEGPGEPAAQGRERAVDQLAFAAKWLGAQIPPGRRGYEGR